MSLTLLAAFRALESALYTDFTKSGVAQSESGFEDDVEREVDVKSFSTAKSGITPASVFRSSILAELVQMGVATPLRPIKQGGVGPETVDDISERFLLSAGKGGQCPAVVSVIGAMASQEAIKAISQVHVPISQLFMFESLDSLLTPGDSLAHRQNESKQKANREGQRVSWSRSVMRGDRESGASTSAVSGGSNRGSDGVEHTNSSDSDSRSDSHNISGSSTSVVASKIYGRELADELARMRVFVVGAGAIGCEVLKTLALMGVGTGSGGGVSRSSTGSSTVGAAVRSAPASAVGTKESDIWTGLYDGGIAITDMDHIERSNLNRQLLFRERHIGQPKATVAAEMIKEINPSIRINAVTNKLCPETEVVFDSAFWSVPDVVLTALDNVDARRYVDEQCVRHHKWLVDSGTLGVKGSTQVSGTTFSQ